MIKLKRSLILSSLPTGMYLVQFVFGNTTIVNRIVKQ
ncbi:MAG: T9SS type A sorting domain-containing protein [Bacteroidales bacterium]|nr:T9SS type A sorting domain-containing protein [Bacteroidales bacterium]